MENNSGHRRYLSKPHSPPVQDSSAPEREQNPIAGPSGLIYSLPDLDRRETSVNPLLTTTIKYQPLNNPGEPPRRHETIDRILASIPQAANRHQNKARDVIPPQLLQSNRTPGNGASILERVRSHLFDYITPPSSPRDDDTSDSQSDDDWDCDASCHTEDLIKTKFPKETRFAMSNLSFCKAHKVLLCPQCLPTNAMKKTANEMKKPDRKVIKIPCPKNILCDRGIHYGECDAEVRHKVNPNHICDQASLCNLPERKKFPVRPRKPICRLPQSFADRHPRYTKDVSCNTSFQMYTSRHADIALKALDTLRITIDEYIPVKMSPSEKKSPSIKGVEFEEVYEDSLEDPIETILENDVDEEGATALLPIASNARTFSPLTPPYTSESSNRDRFDIYKNPTPSTSGTRSFHTKK